MAKAVNKKRSYDKELRLLQEIKYANAEGDYALAEEISAELVSLRESREADDDDPPRPSSLSSREAYHG